MPVNNKNLGNEKMKNALLLVTLASFGAASAVNAEVSSTITLTSDYDFRGLTQTARDPAVQASLDWASESGLYAGVFSSNVDFGDGTDTEIDLYAGFRGALTDNLTFDAGVLQYTYHSGKSDIDFIDIYAGLSYKALSVKYWYSWDVSNTGVPGSYAEINSALPLPSGLSLNLHGGYSFGEYWAEKYFDYSIGVSKLIGDFELSIKWVDGSDLRSARKSPGGVFSSDAKVIFSVATTFPWNK